MNKDRLLTGLGALARQQEEAERDRLDERWDRLAAGTLTPEEDAELRALAASSDEARDTYEAFRPLGADFQARVVDAIQHKQDERRVLPFPKSKAWSGLAAAAGVFFLVRLVYSPAPPLPSGYEAKLDGGFKTARGGETAPPNGTPVYGPGSPFILAVNPKQPRDHPGEVKARAFLSSSTGREDLKPLAGLDDKFESGATGSVHFKKDVVMGEDIKVQPGDWILWTVVAQGSLPEGQEVQTGLRAGRSPNDSWQAICDDLRKEEKPHSAPSQVACVGFRVEGQIDP